MLPQIWNPDPASNLQFPDGRVVDWRVPRTVYYCPPEGWRGCCEVNNTCFWHFSGGFVVFRPFHELFKPLNKLAEASGKLAEPFSKLPGTSSQLAGTLRQLPEPFGKLAGPSGKLPQPLRKLAGTLRQLAGALRKLAQPSRKLPEPSGKLAEPSRKLPQWFRQLSGTWRGLPGRGVVFGGRPVYLLPAVCGALPGRRHGLPCQQDFHGMVPTLPTRPSLFASCAGRIFI